jgi:hypothetical protein
VCNFCTFKTLPDRVYMDGRRYNICISETEQVEGIEAIVRAKGWSKRNVLRELLQVYLRKDGIYKELTKRRCPQVASFRKQGLPNPAT